MSQFAFPGSSPQKSNSLLLSLQQEFCSFHITTPLTRGVSDLLRHQNQTLQVKPFITSQ